ncbi:type II secretion system F family protein [Pseudomonas aeruginosa]
MLNLREQLLFTRNLRSLLKAGVPLDEALERLQVMMPGRRQELEGMVSRIREGDPLSKVSKELLPSELLTVIMAGEQSSGLASVLDEIYETLKQKDRTIKKIRALYKPMAMMLAGIVMFFGFSILVIPQMVETTKKMQVGKKSEPGILTSVMASLSEFMTHNWTYVLAGIAAVIIALAISLRDPNFRASAYGHVLTIPYIGKMLINLHFSLWARYLAMMIRSGFPDITRAVEITSESMPMALRKGIDLFRSDLSLGTGLGVASDPAKLPQDDPRRQWPTYIHIAFLVGQNSGETDDQLLMVSELLLEDAEVAIERIFSTTNLIVISFTATTAALPILSYLTQMVDMMQTAISGMKF